MTTETRALVAWDAALRPPRAWRPGREQWMIAALLVASLLVFVAFVAVLQGAVRRSEAQHADQRARAVAEAACESSRSAGDRVGCLALFDRAVDVAAREAATPATEAHVSYGGVPTAALALGGTQ